MPEDTPPLTDDEIRQELARRAAEGYDTDDELLEAVVEVLQDEHPEETELAARVGRLAPEVFRSREEVERTWSVPTDNDRLDRAFTALERAGIVARQHFTCCQTCGHAEIGDDVDDGARGYTFFHQQDTERAAEGGGLYLAYGAFLPEGTSKEEYLRVQTQIGHEIVAALRAEGLEPSWSGEVTQRISLPLTWRRRRPRR